MSEPEQRTDAPSAEAFEAAAHRLGVDVRCIRAVASVESGRFGAFLDNGEPVILFERHVFSRMTSRRFDGATMSPYPWGLLSDRRAGGYGPVSVQHRKLRAAVHFDHEAALQSCSWGLFQIMGYNYGACGFDNLQAFVNAMYESVDRHLEAFVAFIEFHPRMHNALRDLDWLTFALLYNGPAQKDYDKRLAAAYEALA